MDHAKDAPQQQPLLGPRGHFATEGAGMNNTRFLGYSLMLLAALSQATRAFLFRIAEAYLSYPPSGAVMMSSLTFIVFCSAYLTMVGKWDEMKLPRNEWVGLFVRGLCAATAMFLVNIALARVSVGSVMAMLGLAPAATSLLAAIFLQHEVTWQDSVILIVNVLGVALVAQPWLSGGTPSAVGVLSAILAAIISSIGFVLIRKVGSHVHFATATFSTGICGVVLSLIFMRSPDYDRFWSLNTATWVVLSGACLGCMTQLFVNRGLQITRPGPSLVVRTFNVPIAVLLGTIFLSEQLTTAEFIGILFIILSVFSIGVHQQIQDRLWSSSET